MHFNTTHFEFAHGKKPRGTGNWAFGTQPCTPVEKCFFVSGTFSEAKKAARAHFVGRFEVFVQS